jgi:hypothetical protein
MRRFGPAGYFVEMGEDDRGHDSSHATARAHCGSCSDSHSLVMMLLIINGASASSCLLKRNDRASGQLIKICSRSSRVMRRCAGSWGHGGTENRTSRSR